MVLFNHATREMTAKIVYYGPGLCGKTTNLMVIFDKLDPKNRGKMLSLATKTDRTLFFDLLPVDIGRVGNFNLRIQLYTVPGQVFYNETRKLVLKGADAIVFVVDSQPSMIESNRESFQNLLENLQINQVDANEIPIIIQYNKRDIPGVLPVEELEETLDLTGFPSTEASAVQGEGVMETFKLASKVTARYLLNKLQGKPLSSNRDARREREPEIAAEPEMEPAALPEPARPLPPPINPFAREPFEDASEVASQSDYDRAEEVSLEELLEGRERPLTLSGNVGVPNVEEAPEDVEDAPEEVEDAPEDIEDAPEEVEEFAEDVEESEPEIQQTPVSLESYRESHGGAAEPAEHGLDSESRTGEATNEELQRRVAELERKVESISGVLRELGHRLGSLS